MNDSDVPRLLIRQPPGPSAGRRKTRRALGATPAAVGTSGVEAAYFARAVVRAPPAGATVEGTAPTGPRPFSPCTFAHTTIMTLPAHSRLTLHHQFGPRRRDGGPPCPASCTTAAPRRLTGRAGSGPPRPDKLTQSTSAAPPGEAAQRRSRTAKEQTPHRRVERTPSDRGPADRQIRLVPLGDPLPRLGKVVLWDSASPVEQLRQGGRSVRQKHHGHRIERGIHFVGSALRVTKPE